MLRPSYDDISVLHAQTHTVDKQDEAADARERYKKIVERTKLVELAKAQSQEIAILRTEVERLRMKTFPALVQVHRP